MKKLLFGLGTLSLVILPVTAMVSCSSSIVESDLGIELLSNRTTVTQEAITSATEKIKTASSLPDGNEKDDELVVALNSVFIGVTTTNLEHFEISYGGTELAPTIILTGLIDGNKQYIFSTSASEDKKTLTTVVSNAPTVTINISLKNNITQSMIDEAIMKFSRTAQTEQEMVDALNLVYEGVTKAYLNLDEGQDPDKRFLYVVIEEGQGTKPGKIRLVATPNHKFVDGSTILTASL
ncbi:MAG: hypothetical protein ACRC1F_02405 [Metamycoplasmataceae bacterium]